MEDAAERRQYLFRRCTTRQELHDWVYVFLDLDLPGDRVDEDSTTTPLDMVWDTYSHFVGSGDQDVSRALYYSCRDGGKCVEKGTLLLVKDRGLVPIEEVAVGEVIWSGKNWRPVCDWIHDGIKEGVKLELENGGTLTTSTIHRVWAWRPNQEPGWARVSELTSDDYVCIDTSSGYGDSCNECEDFDIGYFCGILQGDGCLSLMDKYGLICMTASDEVVLEAFKKGCLEYGGRLPRNPGAGTKRRFDWYMASRAMIKKLKGFGLTNSYSYEKDVPHVVLRSRLAMVGFISGLFDTDGTVDKEHKSIIFSMTAEKMLKKVAVMLVALGVNFRFRTEKKMRGLQKHLVYHLIIHQNEIPSLLKVGVKLRAKKANLVSLSQTPDSHDAVGRKQLKGLIDSCVVRGGPDHKGLAKKPSIRYRTITRPKVRKLAQWAKVRGLITQEIEENVCDWVKNKWEKVRSVSSCEADFYDLTVPGDHSYWSNGLISHNTLSESVIEVLALLHLDVSVVHLASIEEQSRNAQRYLKKFFMLPDLRGFVRGDNVRETEVVLYRRIGEEGFVLSESEFKELSQEEKTNYREVVNRVEIVVATMQSVNGKHALLLCLDEIDVLQQPIVYQEAANIPTAINREDGTTQLPLTVLTSTRKTAFGLVQDEINRAQESGLMVKHWNILDVTQKCPVTRHLPLLPKLTVYRSNEDLKTVDEDTYQMMPFKEKERYVKDECYQGCFYNCKMFAACRGRLASKQLGNSRFLKPVKHTQAQFRNNTIEMAQAQLLCWKPTAIGLIYSRFDKARHVIAPAQAYYKIFGELPFEKFYTKAMLTKDLMARGLEAYGGLDFGHTHNMSFTGGFKDGPLCLVTACLSIPELDPGQMITVMEPLKFIGFNIYPDTADPGMIKLLKRAGFKMMSWQKKPGSVVGGINVVKYKLNPPMGEPELFVVKDIEEDSGTDVLIKEVVEYHWKTDSAGKPTDIPSDDNDDSCDSLRYMVMNVFTPKGGLTASMEYQEEHDQMLPSEPMSGVYDKDFWMQQIISQNTGQPMEIALPKERRMVISSPDGKEIDIGSYYEQQNKPAKKEETTSTAKKGRKGRLSWDF